ncbi:RNA polymerase sigma-70 factor [Pedobacter nutrimenti]|uniref:RNA polymerase sigma-70 factor n=1 Tax=Pedobacter nutrimenti TaxID=1241337 RepID=UPI00292EA051|nr:RNA polymerase sigma-70 factor [Pedobacter nutrimenti]
MSDYRKLTDQELIILLKQGDQLAYTQIYDRYQTLLFLHAIKKVREEEDAKDIVQEIFADLWIRKEELSLQCTLSAYLYTCVRNKFVNLLQHKEVRMRYSVSFQSFIDENTVGSDLLIREKQLASLIEKEISALPVKMQKIFVLSRREHKSYKEIAAQLNVSEETVRKQVKNALKILRIKLGTILLFALVFWYYYNSRI